MFFYWWLYLPVVRKQMPSNDALEPAAVHSVNLPGENLALSRHLTLALRNPTDRIHPLMRLVHPLGFLSMSRLASSLHSR